ncbi:hypothetical protein DMH01_36030 [Amycolatopsis sp. WAC 04182]|uniref:hypothetical protein n=1 Tax=Amycolatopsis sp. WAC 04182 TaxID=2203198 RepID=UPI000F7A999A|nr:hypothetical protein [Amycolatopsis sp. WAC 04182]RSN54358.1 hypothetical protein DMH01_36030 [Amycolatopsis sp. WAC 04182]
MTKGVEESVPGLEQGGRGFAGTLFAAFYGGLTPHPWRAPDTDRDAYLVFYERSVAMGWLRDTGLWGMNDAGQEHPHADASLAEWSPDAVGWLAGLLADLSARHGVATPLLLTASRLGSRRNV